MKKRIALYVAIGFVLGVEIVFSRVAFEKQAQVMIRSYAAESLIKCTIYEEGKAIEFEREQTLAKWRKAYGESN